MNQDRSTRNGSLAFFFGGVCFCSCVFFVFVLLLVFVGMFVVVFGWFLKCVFFGVFVVQQTFLVDTIL